MPDSEGNNKNDRYKIHDNGGTEKSDDRDWRKAFRAKQIYAWLHQQLVTSWDEMTNLSKSLREKLSVYPITALSQADVRISKIDGTRKYLFQLEDGNVIEFLNLNKDKNIRVEYIGDRTYKNDNESNRPPGRSRCLRISTNPLGHGTD